VTGRPRSMARISSARRRRRLGCRYGRTQPADADDCFERVLRDAAEGTRLVTGPDGSDVWEVVADRRPTWLIELGRDVRVVGEVVLDPWAWVAGASVDL
jgi:hypothetical protein